MDGVLIPLSERDTRTTQAPTSPPIRRTPRDILPAEVCDRVAMALRFLAMNAQIRAQPGISAYYENIAKLFTLEATK